MGDPVEQFGVGRAVAEGAEVVGAGDEALAEMPAPDSIDHDAGSEGMVGAGEPVGEFEAAALFFGEARAGGGDGHDLRDAAGGGRAEVEMTAADVNGERLDNVGRVADAHGAGHFGGFFFEGGEGGAELLQFGDGVGRVLGFGRFGEGGEFLFGEEGLVGGGDEVGEGLFLRGDFFVEGGLHGEVGG